jgi:hypothetical protein
MPNFPVFFGDGIKRIFKPNHRSAEIYGSRLVRPFSVRTQNHIHPFTRHEWHMVQNDAPVLVHRGFEDMNAHTNSIRFPT